MAKGDPTGRVATSVFFREITASRASGVPLQVSS
jgi:hypothetical protein